MKNLLKLFYVPGFCSLCLIAASFASCSDDDKNSEALILEMTFEDPIVTVQPVIEGTGITFHVAYNATDEDLKELVPSIRISSKAFIDPSSGSKVDFSGDPVSFTVTAEDGVNRTVYTVSAIRNPSPEASITGLTFDDPVVVQQPVINGTDILFYISAEATDDDLRALIPTVEISKNATVIPVSGSKVDFSGGRVEFTVTAEDGMTQSVYTVSCKQIGKHDFEEWLCGNPTSSDKYKYYYPIGWSTCNPPITTMMILGQVNRVSVTQTNEAYTGESAARIETLGTKGTSSLYPKVISGTLFLGQFITDMSNTLNSTKFGIPYNRKPLVVNGYYKYTPGPEFHRCPDPAKYNQTNVEADTKDECAINAILYEITSDDDLYITGVDTYNKEKLTALARLEDGTAKANYTPFSLTMDYLKPFDPTKKYRFAIICSSSRYGDTFSGAPQSVLYVDDIEVISE